MPFLKINDANIYYELHGEGAPLVLIAGYSCDHTFWSLMLHDLASKFQVLIFDNRAVGQTKDDNQPLSVEKLADDTMALIKQLGLDRPHILGQSMGGAIAQCIAKKYPNNISKLIILNSATKFGLRAYYAIESMIRLHRENVSLDTIIDVCLPWFFSNEFLSTPKNVTAFKQAVTDNPYPQSVNDQERQVNAVTLFDSSAWLKDIKAKTLVIASEEDIIALPRDSEFLAKNIPDAQLVYIEGAHSSPLEQSKSVNHAVMKFLI